MIDDRHHTSSRIGLSVDEVASGVGILCFVTLFLAVGTVPFFGQVLLFQANGVEPLPLAVRVFASHHLSEGMPSAVAILSFFGIAIKEVFFLDLLRNLVATHFAPSLLEYLIFRFALALDLQFIEELSIVVIDLMGELLGDFLFLFHEPKQFLLLFVDAFEFCLEICWEFNNFFVSEFFDLLEEASLLRKEGNLDFLGPLVESPDEAEEAVDVVGDGNHFVHEIIQVAIGRSHTKLTNYYK